MERMHDWGEDPTPNRDWIASHIEAHARRVREAVDNEASSDVLAEEIAHMNMCGIASETLVRLAKL